MGAERCPRWECAVSLGVHVTLSDILLLLGVARSRCLASTFAHVFVHACTDNVLIDRTPVALALPPLCLLVPAQSKISRAHLYGEAYYTMELALLSPLLFGAVNSWYVLVRAGSTRCVGLKGMRASQSFRDPVCMFTELIGAVG